MSVLGTLGDGQCCGGDLSMASKDVRSITALYPAPGIRRSLFVRCQAIASGYRLNVTADVRRRHWSRPDAKTRCQCDSAISSSRAHHASNDSYWPTSSVRVAVWPATGGLVLRQLRNLKRVVHLGSEVADGTLARGVAKKQLYCAKVVRPPVDLHRVPSQRSDND